MSAYDDVIEEIRASRRRISEEAGHDLDRYFEHLKIVELKYATQIERFRKRCQTSSTGKTRAKAK